ncbi:MAG: 5'-methylthioadenosine/adenosylhomocysteine nucleosidase [Muribaculaceae bacterium]|nr:5'-methylthioadenosine/adenosylhomocysteine nucleosidase [Muribaculaceae bacterium]
MKIGIIVAMGSELEMLLPLVEDMKETSVNGYLIRRGRMGGNQVAIMQTGIGKVNAAVGAISLIDSFSPDLVVNTGIAGGTGQGAGILDVVIADRIGYHDVYCGPGNARGQVQGLPELFPCLGDKLVNLGAVSGNPAVKRGLIASGDLFVSTPEELKAVLAVQPEAMAVDMESGAIAQVCCLKEVPFLAIRVVSDTPGVENHHEQYGSFFTIAPRSTFEVVRALLS